jgi:hypothetical protein
VVGIGPTDPPCQQIPVDASARKKSYDFRMIARTGEAGSSTSMPPRHPMVTGERPKLPDVSSLAHYAPLARDVTDFRASPEIIRRDRPRSCQKLGKKLFVLGHLGFRNNEGNKEYVWPGITPIERGGEGWFDSVRQAEGMTTSSRALFDRGPEGAGRGIGRTDQRVESMPPFRWIRGSV